MDCNRFNVYPPIPAANPLYHALKILSDPKMRLKGRYFSFNKSPYEKILTEPNTCKGLFTRMIGVPVLMWQRQAHATMTSIWGHVWSVYDLAWPKSSNDHSDMSCSMIFHRTCWTDSILLWFMNKHHSILTVKLVTGLDEWTCST